jgi:predicted NBD/HSP70 family sugar kinase
MADLTSQRELSRLRVIEALFRHPGSSRTQVGRDAGLSRPTVTAVLDELESAGILEQRPAHERSRPAGRPPLQIRLAPRAAFAVGLDFGHQHIRAALCDLSGQPVADDWSAAEVDGAPAASLDLAHELVRGLLARANAARAEVIGVGMGLAAPVDAASGTAFVEGILPGWDGLRPAAEMEARLGLPVKLENDANVGVLGEHRFGAARGARDVAYVRMSAGIGLGLILGGVPYRGRLGFAGELGHVPAVDDGVLCRCGNRGCLETVASAAAVADRLAADRGEPVTVPRAIELVRAGDPGAIRAVATAGEAVGRTVAALVNVLNPELVVIGGELAGAGPLLLDPLRRAIERSAIKPSAAAVEIRQSALGERAEVLGAAALVLAGAPQLLARRLGGA